MNFRYKYSIDVFSDRYISGWCFHRFLPKKRVVLVFSDGAELLGECVANLDREDLRVQRVHPDGRCGFTFPMPESVRLEHDGEITITIKNSGACLAALPKSRNGRVVNTQNSLFSGMRKRFSGKNRLTTHSFFMHIPKTAGTSFNSFVRTFFDPEQIITHIESYKPGEYDGFLEKYHFISGHLRFDMVRRYFLGDGMRRYTLLREPYSHLHSHINWLRGIGENRNSQFYRMHHQSFQQIADMFGEKRCLTHDELQTLVDSLSGVLLDVFDNCQTRHFLEHRVDRVAVGHAAEAIDNLSVFHGVGLTETSHAFQQQFLLDNGIARQIEKKTLNRAKFAPLYDHRDPVTREIVNSLVAADLLLYNHVAGKNLIK